MAWQKLEFLTAGNPGNPTGWSNVDTDGPDGNNSMPNDPLFMGEAVNFGSWTALRGAITGPRGSGRKVIARLPGSIYKPAGRVGFVVSGWRSDTNALDAIHINIYPNGEIVIPEYQTNIPSNVTLSIFLEPIIYPHGVQL